MRRTRRFTAAVGATAVVAGMTIAGASGVAGASSRPADTTLRGSVAPFTATSAGHRQPARQHEAVGPGVAAPAHDRRGALRHGGQHAGQPAVPPLPEPGRVHRALRGHRGAGAQGRRVAALPGLHQRARRRWPFLRGRRGHGPAGRGRLPHPAPAVPVHRHGQRRPVRCCTPTTTPVTVPSSLASSVLGVTGLDNAAPTLPLVKPGHRPVTRKGTAASPEGQGAEVPVLGLLRAARGRRPAPPVRHHQVPDPRCAATPARSTGRPTGPTMSTPARARPSRWWSWA